jgi:hypothetical protein
MFKPNDHVLDYVDDYLHQALSPEDAGYVERHGESCRVCKVALEEARKRFTAMEALPVREASEALIQTTLTRIDTHERHRRRRRRLVLRGFLVGVAACLAILGSGHLYVNSLSASPYDLTVYGQTDLLAGTPGSLRVHLVDHHTQEALAGVPVTIELQRRGPDQVVELARFITDAQGTGQPRFHLPDWPDADCELRISAQLGSDSELITRRVRLKRSWKLMLSSDKPVYQPGQVIHVRALGLRQPDLKPLGDQGVVFFLTDPKGNVIFKRRDQTSKFGIAAVDCPLADEILEGPYAIACRLGDTESKMTVEVQKYVLPKFKLDLKLDHPYYEPRQKVQCSVQADYFFGKPLADAQVDFEVWNTDVRAAKIQSGSTRTDPAGKAVVTFALPDALVGREQDAGDARFTLQVTVTDTAGQKQGRTVAGIVTAQPLRVEVIPEAGTLVPGVVNKVYLFARYADGRPARVDLMITGLEGPSPRRLRTNSLGVASVETTSGRSLELTIEAADSETPRHTARRLVQLTSDAIQPDFLIRPDKAVYVSGETMHLTALGGGQQPVFVDLIKDGQTILAQTIDLADGSGELAIDLAPDWFGTVQLCAYRFGSDGLPVRKTRTFYVRRAGQLAIKTTLDQAEYRPGQRAKLNFTLTDSQGKPMSGALSLAAVDEAVFSVLNQAPGMERTFFMLEQQLLRPIYAIYPWSPDLKTSLPPADQDQFEQALFARTVQTTGGSPMIQTRRGAIATDARTSASSPYSLESSSFVIKSQEVENQRSKGYQRLNMGWVLFGTAVVLLVDVALWFVVPLVWMAVLHSVGISLLLVVVLLENRGLMPEGISSRFSRSDEVASGAKVAGMALANASSPPRVRQQFPETLLWQPQLITDDRGHASLEVSLADSITTWRLTASAVSADGRLGAAQAPIRVFQPFFVDLNLPVALTRGDEISIPTIVYNYLDQAQTVELTLAKAAWFETLDDVVKRIDLAAGEVRSVAYRLRVTKVGNHPLQVTAQGNGVADALKKTIEVVPDGRRIDQVLNGTLRQPAEVNLTVPEQAIEGSAKVWVKLYPSGFSQLVEGLDGIFQRPYGCFEQTSSTTYPNVLALDYLRRTHKSVPDVEAKARQYIHLGYQRLLGFEVSGGGFDWFGRPPANRTLTAYGLLEFQDMARVHDVDPRLIERTRRWLLNQRQPDGSWPPESHGLHDDPTLGGAGRTLAQLSTTVYIAWAVFGSPENRGEARPTLNYLLSHKPDTISDPHVLALVCNALLAIDPKGSAVDAYRERLDGLKHTSDDGQLVWWELPAQGYTTFYGSGRSGSIETTALAALALIDGGPYAATVRGALTWLVAQKGGNGTWPSTQATVLALKALLAAAEKNLGRDRERRLIIAWGPDKSREIVILPDQAEVMQQIDLSDILTPGPHRLMLTDSSGTGTGYQVAFRYHVPGEPRATEEPLSIELVYDRTNLAVGDTVTATAAVVNRLPQTAPMVILDLPIPPGFAAVADDFSQLVNSQAIAKFQVNARSVVVYLRGLEPGKPLSLLYRLRSTMPVKVTAPAAQVYEYYDPDKRGQSKSQSMTVLPLRE